MSSSRHKRWIVWTMMTKWECINKMLWRTGLRTGVGLAAAITCNNGQKTKNWSIWIIYRSTHCGLVLTSCSLTSVEKINQLTSTIGPITKFYIQFYFWIEANLDKRRKYGWKYIPLAYLYVLNFHRGFQKKPGYIIDYRFWYLSLIIWPIN